MGAGASCVCAVGAEASALISTEAVPSFGCSTLGAGASTVGALTAGVSGLASPSEGAGAAAAGFVSVWCVVVECPLCLRRRECDDPCPLVSGRSILPLVTNLGRMSSGISVLITSGSVLVGSWATGSGFGSGFTCVSVGAAFSSRRLRSDSGRFLPNSLTSRVYCSSGMRTLGLLSTSKRFPRR